MGGAAGACAAQWASDCVEGPLKCAHFVQAEGAEGVLAMQNSWEPATTRVVVTADGALQLFF